MHITQHDIANLSDTTAKRLAIMYAELRDQGGTSAPFWGAISDALIRAMQERSRLVAIAELELLNDGEEEGALVSPDDDPVADALRELRCERP
jgi:hypothetical protein